MRIIAGEHRGRILKSPKGKGTRPMLDRVREALPHYDVFVAEWSDPPRLVVGDDERWPPPWEVAQAIGGDVRPDDLEQGSWAESAPDWFQDERRGGDLVILGTVLSLTLGAYAGLLALFQRRALRVIDETP